jgi:hypothetical protein
LTNSNVRKLNVNGKKNHMDSTTDNKIQWRLDSSLCIKCTALCAGKVVRGSVLATVNCRTTLANCCIRC